MRGFWPLAVAGEVLVLLLLTLEGALILGTRRPCSRCSPWYGFHRFVPTMLRQAGSASSRFL